MGNETALALASETIAGSGPLIVYLHGLGCAGSRDWPPVAAHLKGRANMWIDLAGFGRSPRPNTFRYTLEEQAQLLVGMLSASPEAARQPVALVGHSMGGTLAVLVAELLLAKGRAPEAVILAEPNLRPEDATGSARAAAMPEDTFVAGWSGWIEQMDSAWYREMLRMADPIAYHRSASSLVKHGATALERFAALPVRRKAYVLGGQSDDETKETARLVQQRGIPVLTVPRSGHGFGSDDPAGFAKAIDDALALG